MEGLKIEFRASPAESVTESSMDKVEDMYDRERNEAEAVDNNATEHLEKIYPLEDFPSEAVTSTNWLLSSDNGKWPEEIKPFLWRYLHDRCLYNVRKDNLEALERLCQDLKQHLNLKCNSDEDNEIRRKVERQIKYVAGQWKDYGLLVKNEGVYTRAPVLQKHWRHARDKWISQVHHGVTEDLIEICPQEVPRPTSARIVTSDGKEYRSKNYPTDSPSIRDVPLASAPRKRKGSRSQSFGDSFYLWPEDSPDEMLVSNVKTKKRKLNSIATSPKRSSEHMRRTSSTRTMKAYTNVAHRYSEFDDVEDSLSPTQTMYDEDEDIQSSNSFPSATRSDSEEEYSPNRSSRPAGRRGNPIPSPSKSNSWPSSTRSSSGNLTAHEKSSKTVNRNGKARLHFIFEDSKAAQDHPVSAEIFRSANILDFFDLVCAKAFKPQGVVSCLTFRYTWGTLDAFVVDRTAGQEHWMSIKRRVRNKFLIAREDVRNKGIDFEVWVTCGDTTKEVSKTSKADFDDDW